MDLNQTPDNNWMIEISPFFSGWCSTPNQLLICSSFSRENGHPLLICSSLSTAQLPVFPFWNFKFPSRFYGTVELPSRHRGTAQRCSTAGTGHFTVALAGWAAGLGSFVFLNGVKSLVFQIPCEDRCLDPQTPPFWRHLGGTNTYSKGIWKILED